jgi:acetylornithine/succinyldiaminopimelate/putrescine aminotransferase
MEDFEIKTTEELLSNSDKYIMKTYGRFPIVLVRGNGAKVWDSDGNEYLDFLAGIAVCSPSSATAVPRPTKLP